MERKESKVRANVGNWKVKCRNTALLEKKQMGRDGSANTDQE